MGGPGGRPGMNLAILKRALGYSLHHSRFMMLALASMLIGTLAQLAVPQFIQDILDNVTLALAASGMAGLNSAELDSLMAESGFSLEQLTAAANNPLQPLVVSSVLILFFSIGRGVFAFLQAYMAEKNGQYTAYDFRNELFGKISSLSFSYHDRQRTGELMVRATDDVEKLRQFISQGLLMAGQALVLMVASLSILFYTNWRLALVVVPILPVAMLMFMFFGSRVGPLFAMIQQRLAHLNSILQENVAGLQVVQSYVREKSEQARFGKEAEIHMRHSIRVSRFMSVMFPFLFLVANLAIVAVTWYGGRLLIFNELTLGQWSKFTLYITYIFFPIGQFGFIIAMATQASASAARVFEILDTDVEVRNRPNARTLDTVQGMVEFRNVTFRYFEGGEPVLDDVSFGVMPGETIAILGATGSGKSTVINLLPRFYDVTDGAILIDGMDIRDATLDSLRSQIGIVLQETVLFSGTIRDNIAFGRPEATDIEVEAAARDAAIHDFIVSQPNGYRTDVGERGATLSGGQKQRVAIARALLLQPRILILDDSTSSVDLQTEQRIQQALDRLMEQRTSFVIAQRISTVRNADRILVLEQGRLVATGTHATLMESNELYVNIFSSQLVDDSTALAEAQAGWA